MITMRAATKPGTATSMPNAFVKSPRLQLVRHYVETGDERCPLAGLWTQIFLG